MEAAMNDYIALLRHDAMKMFPGATAVNIFITHYEVEVKPQYNGELVNNAMKTLSGSWCTQREESDC